LANVITYSFLQWKCKLSLVFPLSVEAILYDKDERPELFAYFCTRREQSDVGQCT
jgi:hypothetical protein